MCCLLMPQSIHQQSFYVLSDSFSTATYDIVYAINAKTDIACLRLAACIGPLSHNLLETSVKLAFFTHFFCLAMDLCGF